MAVIPAIEIRASRIAWRRLVKNGSGCWIWPGHLNNKGYGTVGSSVDGKRKNFLVHRLIYQSVYGPLLPNLKVLHRCDNPKCARITHLFIGSSKDNTRDAMDKGRMDLSGLAKGREPHETCRRGHPLTGENLYVFGDGKRSCATCKKRREDECRERRMAAQASGK